MWIYFLKRLLYFIPTLLVISLLAFGLSKLAPGDPVEMLLKGEEDLQSGARGSGNSNRAYQQAAVNLGLDKPLFYLSLKPASYPDTLYRILLPDHRRTLRKLVAQYGAWPQVENYYHRLVAWEQKLYETPDSLNGDALIRIRKTSAPLYYRYQEEAIRNQLDLLKKEKEKSPDLSAFFARELDKLSEAYENILSSREKAKGLLPRLHWHGFDNQYHHWISNFLKGDFGVSYYYKQPVRDRIWNALRWTLVLNGSALLLAYLIALPVGVWAGARQGSYFDRISSTFLFMLYSLPAFWIAILLIVFFTTPEYGMDWFPTLGTGQRQINPDMSAWEVFKIRAQHFFLPVLCLVYGALAFISRQMRGGMIEALRQNYIRTARAKGLPENKVIWKHAFRNALFPIITLLASLLPALLAGSVVVETIFSIPGMGQLTVDSIYKKDWSVVYTILMMAAILTMAGILLADLLYTWADPRVRFKKV